MGIPNVIFERYTSKQLDDLLSPTNRVVQMRKFWTFIAENQNDLDVVNISEEDLEKLHGAIHNVDQARIDEIELVTHHDVKANIEAFVEAAGSGEVVHVGMTSRDITDNTEQFICKQAANLVLDRASAVLHRFDGAMNQYRDLHIVARTHNQQAQLTTLGRRFAMYAEPFHDSMLELRHFVDGWKARGLKGAVGTQSDMLKLADGDQDKVDELEKRLVEEMGFNGTLISPGQVYPRLEDEELLSKMISLSASLSNYALSIRLMGTLGQVTEGFRPGQVGSTAMPQKMNNHKSERINSFYKKLVGYSVAMAGIGGDQWLEGDVSCSAARRISIPDAFGVLEGQLNTAITVLKGFGAYPAVFEREVNEAIGFIGNSYIMAEAVSRGLGREEAHEVIRKHSVASALAMREQGANPDPLERIGADPLFVDLGLDTPALYELLSDREPMIGAAKRQIDLLSARIAPTINSYGDAVNYVPPKVK